jgi:hypothetical protein
MVAGREEEVEAEAAVEGRLEASLIDSNRSSSSMPAVYTMRVRNNNIMRHVNTI